MKDFTIIVKKKKVVSLSGKIYYINVLIENDYPTRLADIKIELWVEKDKSDWFGRLFSIYKWIHTERFSYGWLEANSIKDDFIPGIEYTIKVYEEKEQKKIEEENNINNVITKAVEWDGRLGK